jgi:hypothetical protein
MRKMKKAQATPHQSNTAFTQGLLASSLMLVLGACANGLSTATPSPTDAELPSPEGIDDVDKPGGDSDSDSEEDESQSGAGGTPMMPGNQGSGMTPSTGSKTPEPQPPTKSAECAAPTWTNVPALPVQASDANVRSMRAMVDSTCLSVRIEVGSHKGGYALLIDTDGNAKTGYQAPEWGKHGGAEYLVQSEQLNRHDPSVPSMPWKWRDPKPQAVGTTTTSLEFQIPLSAMQASAAAAQIWIGFMLIDGNNPAGQIPGGDSFVQVSANPTTSGSRPTTSPPAPDRSACKTYTPSGVRPARATIGVSKGMIVPADIGTDQVRDDVWAVLTAYDWPQPIDLFGGKALHLSGTTITLNNQEYAWLSLIRAARKLRAEDLDLWVVASAPSSGSGADWQRLNLFWDRIREQGGGVFGQVRTATRPGEQPELIPVDDVAKQVQSWIGNYASLDGVWIDDFIPRYELFGLEQTGTKHVVPSGCDPNVMPPSLPNGACAAPIDRSLLRQNGCYDPAVQIQPAGGYYHTLTSRIRGDYPWMRIIGNARGQLYSNQLKYADLIDVLVSYQQSFTDAARLKAQAPTAAAREAAILHGTVPEKMKTTLISALDRGFSHVYATEQAPATSGTVWTEPSIYLDMEADFVLEHL